MRLVAETLFRVRGDVNQLVDVAANLKIETPSLIDPRLPDAVGLVVFLGAQGRMAE